MEIEGAALATTKKLRPFNPLQIAGRGGLCTAEDINRVEALIRAWSADLIASVNAQFAVVAPAVPATPPGSAGRSYSFRLGPDGYGSSSGTETWADQVQLDLTGFTNSTITIGVACKVSSTAGTGIFRARVGGSEHGTDGVLAGVMLGVTTGLTVARSSVTIPNPGGQPIMQFTTQSSASGQTVSVKYATVTVR